MKPGATQTISISAGFVLGKYDCPMEVHLPRESFPKPALLLKDLSI